MFRNRLPLCLLLCVLPCLPTTALTADDATPGSLNDLGWIVGHWRGEAGDSVIEEQWSVAGGGAMMGMFRWFTEEQVRLYEFMLIESSPEGPVLRIKHFGEGLKGWEEKDVSIEFRLVEHQEGLAVFESDPQVEDSKLVYTHTQDGNLEVRLIKTKDGKENTSTFLFGRH